MSVRFASRMVCLLRIFSGLGPCAGCLGRSVLGLGLACSLSLCRLTGGSRKGNNFSVALSRCERRLNAPGSCRHVGGLGRGTISKPVGRVGRGASVGVACRGVGHKHAIANLAFAIGTGPAGGGKRRNLGRGGRSESVPPLAIGRVSHFTPLLTGCSPFNDCTPSNGDARRIVD